MQEADRVMEDARRRKAPDVDDVLVAPTVVGGQMYTVVAEERALGECIFVLGRGVERGRVGVEVFVKVSTAHFCSPLRWLGGGVRYMYVLT